MAVTRLAFKLGDGTNNIDLAQAMSQVQRTLVHQKQTFTVLGGQIVDNSDATIKISTAPNFWYTRAAINRGFQAWKQMRALTLSNAELDNNPGMVGKYSDFKVTLNGSTSYVRPHYSGGTGAVTSLPAPAEWNHANLEDESGNDRLLRIVGGHDSTWYGLMEGWIRTRATPDATNEPTMPDLDGNSVSDYKEDFINLLHNTGDGQPERLELVYEENDSAPFTVNELFGDTSAITNMQMQSYIYLKGAGAGSKTEQMIAGFQALCGLIQVQVTNGTEPILFLDVVNKPEAF